VAAFVVTLAALITLSKLVGQGPRVTSGEPRSASHAH